jgi:DNA repair protein RadC
MKDLPPQARPREKLLARGAESLSDVELLALLLRTGLRGQPVLMLAQQMLDDFDGLSGLLHAQRRELQRVRGLGPAKQAELLAVLELARRVLAQPLRERPQLGCAQAVMDYLRLQIGSYTHEVFAVLFMDVRHRLIAFEEMFRGTLTQTSVYPREVVLRALHHGCASVVLAHNHPSGVAEPSRADEMLTQTLKSALALVDVQVLDHVVVSATSCVSMAQAGCL